MQNRVSTLWGHPSFLFHTKGDHSRQRWWRVNGETETEWIYSCCKTQRNLSNKGKEGKSRHTWNRTCEVCWVSQPIMHTFPTPREHGKCFTMFRCDVSANNRWWKTVKVWDLLDKRELEDVCVTWRQWEMSKIPLLITTSSCYLPVGGVGCCYGSIRCLRVLAVFWADFIPARLRHTR